MPVSKAGRERLAHPVLSFVVARECEAIEVKPVSEARPAEPAFAVKVPLVLRARLVTVVPPVQKGQRDERVFVAQH
jgi:hypothetical protein